MVFWSINQVFRYPFVHFAGWLTISIFKRIFFTETAITKSDCVKFEKTTIFKNNCNCLIPRQQKINRTTKGITNKTGYDQF